MPPPRASHHLLTITALSEAATGLALLAAPALVLWLLLGIESPHPATTTAARIAGAALLAFGIACWTGRTSQAPQIKALIAAALCYDILAATVLAHTGMSGIIGPALWPAVAAHIILAVWCVWCVWRMSRVSAVS